MERTFVEIRLRFLQACIKHNCSKKLVDELINYVFNLQNKVMVNSLGNQFMKHRSLTKFLLIFGYNLFSWESHFSRIRTSFLDAKGTIV